MEVLINAADWHKMKFSLMGQFTMYQKNGKTYIDHEAQKILNNFDSLIAPISKAEVVAKTQPKYWKHKELLLNFNTKLQDFKELCLLRLMTR